LPEESREHAESQDARRGSDAVDAGRDSGAGPASGRRREAPAGGEPSGRGKRAGTAARTAPVLGLAIAALTLWRVARREGAGA
jgi:hypothetical protein